jgi:hypothetical protein
MAEMRSRCLCSSDERALWSFNALSPELPHSGGLLLYKLPRAQFLHVLSEKGVSIFAGPSSLAAEMEGLARRFGDWRLLEAAADVRPLSA